MTPEPIDAHGPRPAVRSAAGSGWLSTTLDGPKKRRVRDQVEAPVRSRLSAWSLEDYYNELLCPNVVRIFCEKASKAENI